MNDWCLEDTLLIGDLLGGEIRTESTGRAWDHLGGSSEEDKQLDTGEWPLWLGYYGYCKY